MWPLCLQGRPPVSPDTRLRVAGAAQQQQYQWEGEVGLAGRTSWRCHPPGQSLHVHVTLPTVKCPHTGHCVALLTPGPDIGHCLQQAAGAGSSACPCLVCNIYLQLKLYRALQPGRAAVSMRTKKRAGAGPQRQLSQLVHFVLEHVRQQAAAGSGSGNRQVTGPGPQWGGCQKYRVCSGSPGTANTRIRLVLRWARDRAECVLVRAGGEVCLSDSLLAVWRWDCNLTQLE